MAGVAEVILRFRSAGKGQFNEIMRTIACACPFNIKGSEGLGGRYGGKNLHILVCRKGSFL